MRRSTRLVCSSSETLVASRVSSPAIEHEAKTKGNGMARASRKRSTPVTESDAYESHSSDHDDEKERKKPVPKKQKTTRPTVKSTNNGGSKLYKHIFSTGAAQPAVPTGPCSLPERQHSPIYHRPLMLEQQSRRADLLRWFDTISTTRGMPWRKAWIDPASVPDPGDLRQQLERRAYEVWISEIMLQQTRVAVVIEYWNRWMAKWPTIHDLAAASADDVLAMWRGLGYYSRATRIHEAAKLVCGDSKMKGLLPSDVVECEKAVPGVGRYTAGAITAIVFGEASPMVDGNVLRVLSRQMGILGDVKTDKATIDTLWLAADALVKAVAGDCEEDETKGERLRVSDRPGRWGQALMELGSTVCTPKPNCAACPITKTCRAYAEGLKHATKSRASKDELPLVDIEDACTLCQPFEDYAEPSDDEEVTTTKATTKSSKKSKSVTETKGSKKQASLQSFFFTKQTQTYKPKPEPETVSVESDAATLEKISNHARKFPVKTIKKAVREEETLVCAIRRESDGQYLIQKRPEKGLLAGLWEFPSQLLPDPSGNTAKSRKGGAIKFVQELLGDDITTQVKHATELGSVPWLFSHIKLTMHVHLFTLLDKDLDQSSVDDIGQRTRWTGDVEAESMGTGMRKCWSLVKDSAE